MIKIFILLAFFTAASSVVNACQPPFYISVCNEYYNSETVFTGILTETVEGNSSLRPKLINTFKVNETYKGKAVSTIQVSFIGGDCAYPFEVGKEYLVYARDAGQQSIFESRLYSGVRLLEKAQYEVEQIKKLRESKSAYFVNGEIVGIETADKNKIKVTVQNADSVIPLKLNKRGEYSYKLTENKKLRVIVEIPFDADLAFLFEDMKVLRSESSSDIRIEYEVNYSPDNCNYRYILLNKRRKE